MMKIMPAIAFGWLVVFMSVNSVDMFAVDSITETTAVPSPYPESKFYMEIRITNRIYNTTLEDQESADYATLRQEVDQLFVDIYNKTSLEYITTDQMIFRNGSVIAGAVLLFGVSWINPSLEKNLFIQRYNEIKSEQQLTIDTNFVNDTVPTQLPLTQDH